jgi:hypothetical protein
MPLSKNNFSPGAKNWIPKYFQLVDRGNISLSPSQNTDYESDFLHISINKTGLLYGTCSSLIFAKEIDTSKYTKDENLKLLLFETLLLTFQKNRNEFRNNAFLKSLEEFYHDIKLSQFTHWTSFFSEENLETKIERILNDRVKVKSNIFGTNYWLNHLSNSFVFLDVILFQKFLEGELSSFFERYEETALTVFKSLTYAAYLDEKVEEKEQRLLWHFLSCANFEKETKDLCEKTILNGISIEDLNLANIKDPILSKIMFELCIFVTKGTHFLSEKEENKIIAFGNRLGLNENDLQLSFILCNSFLLENTEEVALLHADSNTQFVYKAFSKRWFKILGRNKDKLVKELKESKDLVALIQKSTKEELSKDEKEKVKSQFMDILKSMPSMAIFLLPGGALLLPLILKIVPDLLPSAFKENEVEK